MSTAIPSHLMYVMFLLILDQGNQRRKDYFIRGTAWNFKRSGSRNLSDGYIFLYTWQRMVQSVQVSRHMRSRQIVTVCKAYSSAVGAGAFVSEIFGDEADELRRRGGDGGEFGATTGRPRRMGWFDCVASKYGCRLQGTTDVAFTVLDVLGYLDEIPVCVGYEIDGEVTTDFPYHSKIRESKTGIQRTFRDGNVISVESRNMRIFRKTAENM